MEISLQSVDIDLMDSERAVFKVLKATLEYPTDVRVKAQKLADDINFFCKSRIGNIDEGEILWQLWGLLLDITCCIPPGHPWQECLVQALDSLRQRDGAIPGYGESPSWKDLPNLSFCAREKWLDPTNDDEELSEEFTKWKNLNSFLARFTRTGFVPWLTLPIWQLRSALEEPPLENGSAMGCRVWVATEWIIQCADILFQAMNSKEELDKNTARALSTGSLCEGKAPLSVERWEFWKKRFSELATDAGGLSLSEDIKTRISDALKSMDAAKA